MPPRVTVANQPAPYTDAIIEAFAHLIPLEVPDGIPIHDPFAGDGLKLGALCDSLGHVYSGTDLELWRDRDKRVKWGDSTDPDTYPLDAFAVVTSPTYNNGVNDHFKPNDTSRRLTYRVAAGHALHENNTGRYSGRASKQNEADYWRVTRDVVKHWPDICIVNVKDSIRAGERYPLVAMWKSLLWGFGYSVGQEDVKCPGWRYGTNGAARLNEEAILIARR